MGNCQAAEAAAAVIQHPGEKVERMYRSALAREVMAANPGHYVAVIVPPPPHAAAAATKGGDGASAAPVRHLKLLRPDDTLHTGHVYRLISFEVVLKEFSAKKRVKLGKLLLAQQQQEEEKGRRKDGGGEGHRSQEGSSTPTDGSSTEHHQQLPGEEEVDDNVPAETMGGRNSIGGGRPAGAAARHAQWRPSLQSISEAGY